MQVRSNNTLAALLQVTAYQRLLGSSENTGNVHLRVGNVSRNKRGMRNAERGMKSLSHAKDAKGSENNK